MVNIGYKTRMFRFRFSYDSILIFTSFDLKRKSNKEIYTHKRPKRRWEFIKIRREIAKIRRELRKTCIEYP